MSFGEWLEDSVAQVRADGADGAKRAAYELYLGGFRTAGKVWNYGTPIYQESWDLLIVLDACRADLMAEVVDEYEFVDTETTNSVASSSGEWMRKNFTPEYAEETSRTAYVTANAFSESHLSDSQFATLDEVWRYGFDEALGTIPADVVTDRAIAAHRAEPRTHLTTA